MNFAEYPALAARTEKQLPTYFLRLEHAALGIITEVGEIVTPIKRIAIYGKTLDSVAEKGEDKGKTLRQLIAEEIGDVLWYVAIIDNVGRCGIFNGLPVPDISLASTLEVDALKSISRRLSVYAASFAAHVEDIYAGDTPEGQASDDALGLLLELANLAYVIGADISQIAAANIAKLQLRYPEAYSDLAAEARADKA